MTTGITWVADSSSQRVFLNELLPFDFIPVDTTLQFVPGRNANVPGALWCEINRTGNVSFASSYLTGFAAGAAAIYPFTISYSLVG